MQLDFLTKLITRLSQPSPEPEVEKKSESAPEPGRDGDPIPDLTPTARELLRSVGCEEVAARLQVRWNPKMRSTAGMAYPGRSLVTLNPRLLAFGQEEVERTLRHELAHLLAQHRAGRRRIAPHGPEWRRACQDLGLADESRCHTLPLPRRQMTRKHAYRCQGCGTTIRRVRPLKRKVACLACCRKHSGGRYDERFRFIRVSE